MATTTTKKTTKRRSGSAAGAAFKAAAASVVGGALGAVAGHLLRDFKVKPTTVGLGLTAAGGVGAVVLKGTARWFSAGVATSGASQWTTEWAKEGLKRKGLPPDSGIQVYPLHRNLPPGPPPDALPIVRNVRNSDILEAFEEAERELAGNG